MKKIIQKQKIAFIDRDGVLIFEPSDTFQVDSLTKLKILPGVQQGLKNLIDAGYLLVMVSNQDGLGTSSFPQKDFDLVQNSLIASLATSGITFEKVFICPHFKKDNCSCRKPNTGLVDQFLKEQEIDCEQSFMLGDRETDMQFAKNLGIQGYGVKTNARFPRLGFIERISKETKISAGCNLDGQGIFSVKTGLDFFDHMLEQFSKHSLIDLNMRAHGDLNIDEHHTVEDVGLVLGQVLAKALGERRGIQRYGFLLPMDDTLVEVVIDLGGRPYFVFDCSFSREYVGDLPTELIEHFFRSVADSLRANIHINVKYSKNEHHKIEAIFKAFAKAMKMATAIDMRVEDQLPTTKGFL